MSLTLAQALRLRPRFRCVAVTGTNGKTTTTTMTAAIFAAAGRKVGRVTTLGAWAGKRAVADDTSEAGFIGAIERLANARAPHLVVETTSQALEGGFATRWPADVAVFTNLTNDHLDAHGTLEAHLAAKAQLFATLPEGTVAVFNACDESSALLDEVTPSYVRRVAYATGKVAPACRGLPIGLAASAVWLSRTGTRIALQPSPLALRLGGSLKLEVLGAPNADNALAAALAADACGVEAPHIAAGLRQFQGVPGRFQVLSTRPLVIVDFAHSPDSLSRVLGSVRSLLGAGRGHLCCVFGCGGDRDSTKRERMGKVVGDLCDRAIVTNDNPRSENPYAIVGQIAVGLAPARAEWSVVLDRAEAIAAAISAARPLDAVVIAGKGHEREQIIGDRTLPFSDVAVARRALRKRSVARVSKNW